MSRSNAFARVMAILNGALALIALLIAEHHVDCDEERSPAILHLQIVS